MLLYYDSIFPFLSLKFKYSKGSIIAQPKGLHVLACHLGFPLLVLNI